MNTNRAESLSAFLDDEAGEFEQRRLLDDLKKDEELGQTFTRYALIGEAVRAGSNGQRAGLGVSMLSRIQEELEDEPVYTNVSVQSQTAVKPRQGKNPVRSFRVVGMALAATVAAVAVGGLMFMQHPAQETVVQAKASVNAPVNANAMVADAGETEARIRQVGRVDPQTRDILKQYVAQHVKYASTTAFAPSIRAVSYANEH
jgi:sigma-E factor negative regulatory protein RseA